MFTALTQSRNMEVSYWCHW